MWIQFYHINSINAYSVYLKAVGFLANLLLLGSSIELHFPWSQKHGTNEVSTALPLSAKGTEVHCRMLWEFSCVLLTPACEVWWANFKTSDLLMKFICFSINNLVACYYLDFQFLCSAATSSKEYPAEMILGLSRWHFPIHHPRSSEQLPMAWPNSYNKERLGE